MTPSESPPPQPRIQQRAVAAWEDSLRSIVDQQAWVDAANASLREAGLVMHERPICRVARPRLLADSAGAADRAVVTAAIAALAAASEFVLADEAMAQTYLGDWATDPTMRDLFSIPAGYDQPVVMGRFDGVSRPEGLDILEFNGGLPGGVLSADGVGRVMRQWSPFADLTRVAEVTVPDIGGSMAQALLSAWHGFGGIGLPLVAFAVPEEFREYVATPLAYTVGRVQEQGVETLTVDPGALVRERGGLWVEGRRVDVVVRVFLTSMVPSLADRLAPLLAAARAGEVCLVTSFRSSLLGHKSLFAVITDPDVDLGLSTAQRDLVHAHVPWSRMLADGTATDAAGEPIDLLAYATARRDDLVLKPADGSGGAGVHLGWEEEPEQWQASIDSALAAGTWILQQRLPLAASELPDLEPGFANITFTEDHNPIVCDGQVAGYFVRLSESGGITNMTSGHGTVTSTFMVGEPGPGESETA